MKDEYKSVAADNTKTEIKLNKNINNNIYLHMQIFVTAVMLLACVILKVKNQDIFYQVKEDYNAFFTAETVYESNFSYKSFLNKITEETKKKYNEFLQTVAYLYGQGKNDIYPSNVSTKKYIPEQKGIMPLNGYITSNFGIRKDPFDKKVKDFHTGLDIAAAKGTFIKAAFDGIVTETGYTDIAGNYIRIGSSEEMQTFYGHTQFVFVKQGDTVIKSQPIATVGDTGLVTGPHLHFEVVYKGNRVNPVYTIE